MKNIIVKSKIPFWIIGVVLSFLIWQLASYFNWLDNTILASPEETFNALFKKSEAKTIWSHTGHTLKITTIGWVLSIILGSLIGALFGFVKPLLESFRGVFEFVRAIPPILAFPLMLVSFNYETSAYVYTIVFGCVPIMFLTVTQAILSISKDSIDILRISGVKKKKIVFARMIESFPGIIIGARLSFSFALIIAVVTEMVLTHRSGLGLGSFARDAEMSFDTPSFYAVLIILGFIGFIGNYILLWIEKNLKIL
jgi:NitT/TauT family transport system permease protein